MKTSALIQNKSVFQSLFLQIAARFEDFAPATASKSPPPRRETPFADLMMHPEKLEAALKTAKSENDAFSASRTFGRNTSSRPAQNSSPKSKGACRPSGNSPGQLKKAEFHFEAPFAESVKLAADFTEWEKFRLDMIISETGVWFTIVP